MNSVLAECDVLHGLVETSSLLKRLLWAIVWPAGIEIMNKTLSNNFIMEEDLEVREKNAEGGENVKNKINTDKMKHYERHNGPRLLSP